MFALNSPCSHRLEDELHFHSFRAISSCNASTSSSTYTLIWLCKHAKMASGGGKDESRLRLVKDKGEDPEAWNEFLADEDRQSFSYVRPFASASESTFFSAATLDSWFRALHPDSFGAANDGAWTDSHYKVRWTPRLSCVPARLRFASVPVWKLFFTCPFWCHPWRLPIVLLNLCAPHTWPGRDAVAQNSLGCLWWQVHVWVWLLGHVAAADNRPEDETSLARDHTRCCASVRGCGGGSPGGRRFALQYWWWSCEFCELEFLSARRWRGFSRRCQSLPECGVLHCMCVCMSIHLHSSACLGFRLYADTHICIYTYLQIQMCIYIIIYTNTCMSTNTYMYICGYAHVFFTYIYRQREPQSFILILEHIYTYMYIYI